MEYNLLSEPWIPVRKKDGSKIRYGLLDLFSSADGILEIDEVNAMKEYSLIRFLTTFLMAAYMPSSSSSLRNIYMMKKFDMEQINNYVAKCLKEGVSFDIFDKIRPFLQAPFDPQWDGDNNIKSVAALDYTLPSGHNAVHFDHTLEADAEMEPSDAVAALLSCYIFCTAGTQGPSNVYGAPPLFMIPAGQNLFETLIHAMVPVRDRQLSEKQPELWRNNEKIEPGKKAAKVSLLYGMLYPSRRIRMIEDNGMVKKVYLQAGLDYIGYDAWKDPHVAYYKTKKGESRSIKPSVEKELWRNIGTIANNPLECVPGAAQVVYQSGEYFSGDRRLPLIVWGAVTDLAAYLDVWKGTIFLNAQMLASEEKSECIFEAVKEAERYAAYLKAAFDKLCGNKKGRHQKYQYSIQETLRNYYSCCEESFYGQLYTDIDEMETEEQRKELLKKWKQTIATYIWDQFNRFCDRMEYTGRWVIDTEMCRKELYYKLRGFVHICG